MVSGTPFPWLDVLEFSNHHADHDCLHFLWHPHRTEKKKCGRAAELCRISLWKRWTCNAVCGARPRAETGLVALGTFQCALRWRPFFSGMRARTPAAGTKSFGRLALLAHVEHPDSRDSAD